MGLPAGLVTGCYAKLPGVFLPHPKVPKERRPVRPNEKPARPIPPVPAPTQDRIAVHVAWPDRKLWPNGRPVPYARSAAVKKARGDALGVARAVAILCRGKIPLPLDRAEVLYRFHSDVRRRRDAANLATAMKPSLDGLVDAGLIVDDSIDHVTELPPEVVIDGGRWVEIVVRPVLPGG